MKIRIIYEDYPGLIKEIKDRVRKKEFATWEVVSSKSDTGGQVTRIVHNGEDKQYSMVELGLFSPKAGSISGHVDIIPKKKLTTDITDDEFHKKSLVVIGRFCEVLNRYFPQINEYTVYTK